MKMLFVNNAEVSLASTLLAQPDSQQFTVDDLDAAELFPFLEDGYDNALIPLTLTHPDFPNTREIVHLVDRNGMNFKVIRAQEFTDLHSWPVGTKASANVTAGMLGSFLQDDGTAAKEDQNGTYFLGGSYDKASEEKPSGSGENFLYRTRTTASKLVQFGAYPALHDHMSKRPGVWGGHSISQDLAFGHEATGMLAHVDIGEPPPWQADKYFTQGNVVRPTVPGPYQFWLNLLLEAGAYETVSSIEPDFDSAESSGSVPIYDTVGDEQKFMGSWVRTDMSEAQLTVFEYPLMVTEVGFIGRVRGDMTQPPSISVGDRGNSTRFVNAVSLEQLTPDGELFAHRIAVPGGGHLVEEINFTLNQAGVGASIKGRFYWRGIFYAEGF